VSIRHLDRIRAAVRDAGADALWLHPAVDFRYLTGLAPLAVERPTALVILAGGGLRVLAPEMLAPELELVLDAGILAGLRERKAPDELEPLRAAAREADDAMAWVARADLDGRSERSLSLELQARFLGSGAASPPPAALHPPHGPDDAGPGLLGVEHDGGAHAPGGHAPCGFSQRCRYAMA
jgi:Xaa-Pro aminopeptidase